MDGTSDADSWHVASGIADGRAPSFELDERLRARFEVGAVLGRGGMGIVYAARDVRSGREVALKVVKVPLTPVSCGSSTKSRRRASFSSCRTLPGQA